MEKKEISKPIAAVICQKEEPRQLIKSVIEKKFDVYIFESVIEDTIKNINIQPAILFIQFDIKNIKATKESLTFAHKNYPSTIIILIVALKKQSDIMKALKMAKAYVFINSPYKPDYIFQAAVVSLDKYQRSLVIANLKITYQKKIQHQQLIIEKYKERETIFRDKIEIIKNKAVRIQEKEKEYEKKIDYFDEKLEIRTKLSEQLSSRNNELELLVMQLESFPSQVIFTLNKFNREMEYYYYTDHFQYVREIAIAIAKDAEFSGQDIKILQMAVILHNTYTKLLPVLLRLSSPIYLDDNLRTIYFKAFNKTIETLSKINSVKPYVNICKQIWEHNDGTGFPLGLHSKEISKISQVIAVANQYHDMVYRVFPEQLAELHDTGTLIQSPTITSMRHKEAINFFGRNSKWYNFEIVKVLQELSKHKENRFITPKNKELKVEYTGIEVDLHKDSRKITNVEDMIFSHTKYIYDIAAKRDEKIYVQRIVPILQIKQNMKTITPIITVNGITAVNENKIIDAEDLKKLLQLHQADVINDEIDILVPIYK